MKTYLSFRKQGEATKCNYAIIVAGHYKIIRSGKTLKSSFENEGGANKLNVA